MCSVSGWAPPLQQSSGLSSPGTWPVVPETPLCASGISALRHRISRAKVSVHSAFEGVLMHAKWLAQSLLVRLRRIQPISILFLRNKQVLDQCVLWGRAEPLVAGNSLTSNQPLPPRFSDFSTDENHLEDLLKYKMLARSLTAPSTHAPQLLFQQLEGGA